MKIYTKTGDAGETGLFGGLRVSKDSPRIEAYGTVDELNALLGLVRVQELPAEVDRLLANVQNELFNLGAQLATPAENRQRTPGIAATTISRLESEIDRFEVSLSLLKEFILPGGTPAAAQLHLARTVCRRAERCVVALSRLPDEVVAAEPLAYLNRLSDLLFVLARAMNAAAGCADTPWQKG